MIGQDFGGTGAQRHVTRRLGDGRGHPFPGPVSICSVRLGVIAVLTSENSIVIHNLRGYSEHKYYPLSSKESVLRRQSVVDAQLIEQARPKSPEDDWQVAFLQRSGVSVTDLLKDIDNNSQTAPYSFIDMQPTSICKVATRNALAITDSRFCVHILDLDAQTIIQTFGKGGYGAGEFAGPTSVATLTILLNNCPLDDAQFGTFYFVGDSQAAQKIRVFWPDFTQAAEAGGLGPARGQFHDIASISCFDPSNATVTSLRHTGTAASPAEERTTTGQGSTTSAAIALLGGVHCADTATGFTAASTAPGAGPWSAPDTACLPSWYRGKQCFEDLEAMLYDECFHGNFLVAQRKKRVFQMAAMDGDVQDDLGNSVDSEDLLELPAAKSGCSYSLRPGGTTSSGVLRSASQESFGSGSVAHSLLATVESEGRTLTAAPEEQDDEPDDLKAERIFDVLCISRFKKLDHMVVRENKSPGFELGYYVSNSVDPVRMTYPCILDLLKAQKQHRLTLGGDTRPYVYVAACDQGNYRVQVFRFYWTQNFMFQPELQLAYMVGGASKSYVELFDPTAVAYTPTGTSVRPFHVCEPRRQLPGGPLLKGTAVHSCPCLSVLLFAVQASWPCLTQLRVKCTSYLRAWTSSAPSSRHSVASQTCRCDRT
jgi:hypothetical protein